MSWPNSAARTDYTVIGEHILRQKQLFGSVLNGEDECDIKPCEVLESLVATRLHLYVL